MKKTQLVLMILFMGILFSSCATSTGPTQGYANTLEEAHPNRLEKTVIGMDINEFKTIWPEATRSGVSEDGETYEFIYIRLSNMRSFVQGYDYKIFTHFYFTNNQLVKYESEKRIM
jgi:hypothetical protein